MRAGRKSAEVHDGRARGGAAPVHGRAGAGSLRAWRGRTPGGGGYGRGQAGKALATQSALYPMGMNEALAEALARALGAAARQTGDAAECPAAGPPGDVGTALGGRLAEGAALAGEVRAAVAAARRTPAPFASARNLEPERAERLALEPLPGDLRAPQPAAAEGKRARAKVRRALPRGGGMETGHPPGARAGVERPIGDIAIHQLFQEGVYAGKVQAWFEVADVAVDAPTARGGGGGGGARVPTVVIEQRWRSGPGGLCGTALTRGGARRFSTPPDTRTSRAGGRWTARHCGLRRRSCVGPTRTLSAR
eukprot:2634830-Pleurochrysis_carterae.AAC.1